MENFTRKEKKSFIGVNSASNKIILNYLKMQCHKIWLNIFLDKALRLKN
jgi:hypothetical protein